MKKIIAAVLLICCYALVLLAGCAQTEEEYIRIHIRANGNSAEEQEVKLKVRDAVVEYLTPLLAEAETARDAEKILKNSLDGITNAADKTLSAEGCTYRSAVTLGREEFPARSYGELTLDAGSYEALIVNLGSGKGDNWWCVAFPPLCFVPEKDVKYKSKIMEIIEKWQNEN